VYRLCILALLGGSLPSCFLPVLIRVSVTSSVSFVIVGCSLGLGGAGVRTCLGSRSCVVKLALLLVLLTGYYVLSYLYFCIFDLRFFSFWLLLYCKGCLHCVLVAFVLVVWCSL
jgi:hypothetical protein